MTSHYYPSYCESIGEYPFVGKVSVEGKSRVDFIYQFVSDCNFYRSEDNANTCSTVRHICGTPTKFPKLDWYLPPNIFVYSSYCYNFISISLWQNNTIDFYTTESEREGISNYFDIMFHEAVYPIRVSIFEIYNPGKIIRILAQNSNNQWFLLWVGLPLESGDYSARLFSPPLRSCNFKTKKLRLIFDCNIVRNYYTAIDAVMLIGTSELIFPKNPEEDLTKVLKKINCMYYYYKDDRNLTPDYKNAHLDIDHLRKNFSEYCIIRKSNIGKSFYKSNFEHEEISQEIFDYVQPIKQDDSQYLLLKNYLYDKSANHIKLSLNESEKLSCCSFSALPDEIILKILKNLNLPTLCNLNQVNKRFNNLTRDPRLYTRLNVLRIQNPKYITNVFCYFISRCKYLKQLDLSKSRFYVSIIEKFLDNCGTHLKHLRLFYCRSVSNSLLLKISKICKNLKELDLRGIGIDVRFSCLQNLENLEHLRLSHINDEFKTKSICQILQKNQRMRELTLERSEMNLEKVAIELRNSCQDLETINFFRTYITPQAINVLADCKSLRRVYLCLYGMENIIANNSLCRILLSCQGLEEVYLCCITVIDHTLELLAQCENLKHLYFQDANFITPHKCFVIFEHCRKLEKVYFFYCSDINYCLGVRLKKKYPNVHIRIKYEKYRMFK